MHNETAESSVLHAADNNDNDNDDHDHDRHGTVAPAALRWVPWCFRFDQAPIEASGLALDMYGRGGIFMSSLFLGPALLELAYAAAGCEPDDEDCDNKVYGFRPSSLLSNIAIVAGVSSSILLPLFGAIVDHTGHRRRIGAYSAAALAAVKGAELMVGPNTWFYVAILQIVSSMLYQCHLTATYAYTSELSSDGVKQSEYNSSFFVILYMSMLIFMVEVLTIAGIVGTDDIGTARISQTITGITAAICFFLAWKYLFRERPALSQVPPGMGILTCGFRKIIRTCGQIQRDHDALKWFLFSVMFAEAGSAALVTIATTYMKDVLRMESTEIGAVFLVSLIMGIPGSKFGGYVAIKLRNPVTSAKLCNTMFVVTTGLAVFFLKGPDDKGRTFIFSAFWGLCLAWQATAHVASYTSIIPRGQEAELMGIYLFSGQIFSWLPPLVFTILNETGFPMALGLASLNIFFGVGLICLFWLGDYDSAVAHVRDEVELSHPFEHASEHRTPLTESDNSGEFI